MKKANVSITLAVWAIFSLVSVLAAESPEMSGCDNGSDLTSIIYQKLRASHPRYSVPEAETVEFTVDGKRVVGTLTIPNTPFKPPVILTMNGFTGNRFDVVVEGVGEHYYARVSRIMAEYGIASLRIDFRGSGESEGQYHESSLSTQISDIQAAIQYLKKRVSHRLDVSSIGLLGYSQGAIVAANVAAQDSRISSVVMWSAPAYVPAVYERLFTPAGIKRGMELPAGEYITLDAQYEGVFLFSVTLGAKFFQDLYRYSLLGDVSRFKTPLMVLTGKHDILLWPQPMQSDTIMSYHTGKEKHVVIDADHSYNYWEGPAKLDEAIYWSLSWFIQTLNCKYIL